MLFSLGRICPTCPLHAYVTYIRYLIIKGAVRKPWICFSPIWQCSSKFFIRIQKCTIQEKYMFKQRRQRNHACLGLLPCTQGFQDHLALFLAERTTHTFISHLNHLLNLFSNTNCFCLIFANIIPPFRDMSLAHLKPTL